MDCPVCGSQVSPSAVTCPVCGAQLIAPTSHLLPAGSRLQNGRYSIGKMLGQGGFGITYQGADVSLMRPVAIKEFFPAGSTRHHTRLIPPTQLQQDGFLLARQRFIDEARLLSQFDHPGIVQVLDIFEENQTAYLVMELLQGQTLAARIAQPDPMDATEVLEVARKVLVALQLVHQAGLLHRDLKPDNILLAPEGRVVLIDFGSARQFASQHTVSHTRLVTPGYAPLEQYASMARFGPYTDLYALGATLLHALTGQIPPSANDRLLGSPLPTLPRNIPNSLAQALEASLSLKVEDRPQNVEALQALLQEDSLTVPLQFGRLADLPPLSGHLQPVSALAFSLDGKVLVSGSYDHSIRVWQVSPPGEVATLRRHTSSVGALAFHPSGILISGSRDKSIRLWNLSTQSELAQLTGHLEGVAAVTVSPDGTLLASGSLDGTIKVWEFANRHEAYTLRAHTGPVTAVAFHPNGLNLVSGGQDQTVRWWTLSSRQARLLVTSGGPVSAIAFSPRGQLLSTTHNDFTNRRFRIKIRKGETGDELATLMGHTGPVQSLSFGPGSLPLFSASTDRTLRVWDPQTFRELAQYAGPSSTQSTMALSPTGSLIASSGDRGTIRLWALQP